LRLNHLENEMGLGARIPILGMKAELLSKGWVSPPSEGLRNSLPQQKKTTPTLGLNVGVGFVRAGDCGKT